MHTLVKYARSTYSAVRMDGWQEPGSQGLCCAYTAWDCADTIP